MTMFNESGVFRFQNMRYKFFNTKGQQVQASLNTLPSMRLYVSLSLWDCAR